MSLTFTSDMSRSLRRPTCSMSSAARGLYQRTTSRPLRVAHGSFAHVVKGDSCGSMDLQLELSNGRTRTHFDTIRRLPSNNNQNWGGRGWSTDVGVVLEEKKKVRADAVPEWSLTSSCSGTATPCMWLRLRSAFGRLRHSTFLPRSVPCGDSAPAGQSDMISVL